MKTDNVQNETLIRREVRSEGGYVYSYELLMRESSRTASYRIILYSVKVSMTDIDGNTTSSDIKDAFADSGRAILFFNKIVKNLCTPIDLAYIHEDELFK